MLELMQNEANKYGLGISKRELVVEIYKAVGNCSIFNEIYLSVEGCNYQVIKSKKQNKWIVKKF